MCFTAQSYNNKTLDEAVNKVTKLQKEQLLYPPQTTSENRIVSEY